MRTLSFEKDKCKTFSMVINPNLSCCIAPIWTNPLVYLQKLKEPPSHELSEQPSG